MALWTDLATWRGPTVNEGDGDGRPGEPEDRAVECRGLVVHIAEGNYEGTISWQRNPASRVSSDFVVDLDGTLAQMVDTADRAWTQIAGNGHWLSVECAGFTPNALTAAQCETIARLLARCHTAYGVPLQVATSPAGSGLGHHSMGTAAEGWTGPTWGHDDCPGPAIKAQKAGIVARAIEILGGDDMPTAEEIANAVWARPIGGNDYHDTGDQANGFNAPAAEHLKFVVNDHNFLVALSAKLDRVLTLLDGDGTSGATAQEIAKAVNDDAAARLAD